MHAHDDRSDLAPDLYSDEQMHAAHGLSTRARSITLHPITTCVLLASTVIPILQFAREMTFCNG